MKKDIIFLPYYIDEGRLLDIYSIINQGYSEFDEVQLYSNIEKSKSAGLGLHFKVFKVGSENINKKNKHVSILSKKIQTLSSILNYVLSFFLEKKLLIDINNISEGSFIEIDSFWINNSIYELLDDIYMGLELGSKASEIGELSLEINNNTIKKQYNKNQIIIKKMMDFFKSDHNRTEIVYEHDNYVFVAHINKNYLYQSLKSDILERKLKCFAQVKGIFDGQKYRFLKDNNLKIISTPHIQEIVDSIINLNSSKLFDFETNLFTKTIKKVIELEIISLYKVNS